MACLIVGQTDAQETYNVFFLMADIENPTEGDDAQLEYFENRGDIGFIDLWDNNRINDPDAWEGLTPLEWADALDLVWVDEYVTSSRVEDGELQDTTTPIINNENFACDILGIIGPDDDDDHGSPGTLNDAGAEIAAGTHFGTDLLIVDDSHPIAVGAGLSNGVHTIYENLDLQAGEEDGGRMSWCIPNDEAHIVALFPDFAEDYPKASPLFVHEEGDELADGRIAPALRILSFLSDVNCAPPALDDPGSCGNLTGAGHEATLLTNEGWALVDSIVNYALGIPPTGVVDPDFNDDGVLGVPDIDVLVGEIAGGNMDPSLDMNEDGEVNLLDVDEWLSLAGNANLGEGVSYLAGDANLSGVVDAADLNQVGLNWQTNVSAWSAGDFNADGAVSAPDLNVLGINWQQSALAASTAAVPEPNSCLLVIMSGLVLLGYGRRNR
jgi:hypothetical protein